jgi:hypothetical protein
MVDWGAASEPRRRLLRSGSATCLTPAAMEAGVHLIWISEQLQELGYEVIVANAGELRAISHCHHKSNQVDAEKLARHTRLNPNNPPADCPPYCRATTSSRPASCTSAPGAATDSGDQRGSWTDEGLRPPYAHLRNPVFLLSADWQRCFPDWASARTRASADRGDDAEDQALRPADPATRPDRVPRDARTAEGPRRTTPNSPDLRADSWKQAVRTKPRCRLLSQSSTAAKPVRRS